MKPRQASMTDIAADFPAPQPVARRTDLATSHQAEAQLDPKHRQTLVRRVERAVHERPGMTRGELAVYLDLPQDVVWRRVSDALSQGLIIAGKPRRWPGSKRSQRTLWPPGHEQEAA